MSKPYPPEPDVAPALTAYVVSQETLSITPASAGRHWMAATTDRFANRCLPMLIANQAGWHIVTTQTVTARWDGTTDVDGVRITAPGYADTPCPAVSHFGHGLLTWTMPWLFRTSPGWDLHIRGPANWPVSGASPLEGVVETDWTPATFTMNWQLTTPYADVVFPAGNPIAMIVPQQRGILERIAPTIRALDTDSGEQSSYIGWQTGRREFNRDLDIAGSAARQAGWQRDYLIGPTRPITEPRHVRRLHLRPFQRGPH